MSELCLAITLHEGLVIRHHLRRGHAPVLPQTTCGMRARSVGAFSPAYVLAQLLLSSIRRGGRQCGLSHRNPTRLSRSHARLFHGDCRAACPDGGPNQQTRVTGAFALQAYPWPLVACTCVHAHLISRIAFRKLEQRTRRSMRLKMSSCLLLLLLFPVTTTTFLPAAELSLCASSAGRLGAAHSVRLYTRASQQPPPI